MLKKSCQILVYKSERKLPRQKLRQFGYTLRSTMGNSGASAYVKRARAWSYQHEISPYSIKALQTELS